MKARRNRGGLCCCCTYIPGWSRNSDCIVYIAALRARTKALCRHDNTTVVNQLVRITAVQVYNVLLPEIAVTAQQVPPKPSSYVLDRVMATGRRGYLHSRVDTPSKAAMTAIIVNHACHGHGGSSLPLCRIHPWSHPSTPCLLSYSPSSRLCCQHNDRTQNMTC